jgi:hypothetical protein
MVFLVVGAPDFGNKLPDRTRGRLLLELVVFLVLQWVDLRALF